MSRLPVAKTYKLYIGGKFPRSESGRCDQLKLGSGKLSANIARASRKDFRNAVVQARSAQKKWDDYSSYLKSQIIYRIAEVLESRGKQLEEELVLQGLTKARAKKEVELSIDLLVQYAGWADKYQQIFSSVNPVASSHFNFSLLEPMGVVGVIAPQESGLLGLVSTIIPSVISGNTVVVLASEKYPMTSITLSEVLATSDVPGGVVNMLTGRRSELLSEFSSHMDLNGVLLSSDVEEEKLKLQKDAALNIKRSVIHSKNEVECDPYRILEFTETKTTWHPVGG